MSLMLGQSRLRAGVRGRGKEPGWAAGAEGAPDEAEGDPGSVGRLKTGKKLF